MEMQLESLLRSALRKPTCKELKRKVKLLAVSDSVIPWIVAHQTPLFMGFPRQEYRRGSHFLLQGVFQTQGLNMHLLHCRQILYHLRHKGKELRRRENLNCSWLQMRLQSILGGDLG